MRPSVASTRIRQSDLGVTPGRKPIVSKAKHPEKVPDLSWLRYLPEEALGAFWSDFQAAVGARDWPELNRLLISWRSTALIYSDPKLAAKLTNPVADDVSLVPRPS